MQLKQNLQYRELVAKERTLAVYVDLAKILYVRDVAARRALPAIMLHITANNTNALLLQGPTW